MKIKGMKVECISCGTQMKNLPGKGTTETTTIKSCCNPCLTKATK